MSGKPEARIARARLLGTMFSGNRGKVIGQDGACSIPLPDGRSFWTFGDTLLGPGRRGYDDGVMGIDDWLNKDSWAKANVSMISNAGGFTSGRVDSLFDGIEYVAEGGRATEMLGVDPDFKHSAGRYRPFWPMDGIYADGKLWVYYIMVDCATAPKPGEVDIKVYGTGLAVASPPEYAFRRVEASGAVIAPSDPVNAPQARFALWNNEPQRGGAPDFGVAVLKRVLDGMLYVYGSRMSADGRTHEVCLARAPLARIDAIDAYEYYDGAGWCSDYRRCASIFSGNSNELSVAWNPYLGRYIAFYGFAGEGEDQRGAMEELRFRTAPAPEGPWSDSAFLFDMRKSIRFDYCYAGKEHPEYQERGGKIAYVTFISHQRYLPELLEVEFE